MGALAQLALALALGALGAALKNLAGVVLDQVGVRMCVSVLSVRLSVRALVVVLVSVVVVVVRLVKPTYGGGGSSSSGGVARGLGSLGRVIPKSVELGEGVEPTRRTR